jgi:hypothetical protein
VLLLFSQFISFFYWHKIIPEDVVTELEKEVCSCSWFYCCCCEISDAQTAAARCMRIDVKHRRNRQPSCSSLSTLCKA